MSTKVTESGVRFEQPKGETESGTVIIGWRGDWHSLLKHLRRVFGWLWRSLDKSRRSSHRVEFSQVL